MEEKRKLPLKFAFSAGGVVYRRGPSGIEIVLVRNREAWTLPKGLIEKGEKPEQAAIREVKEETGLLVEARGKIGEIEYWYVSHEEGVRYRKKVYFFLFEATGGDVSQHDWELEEVKFFPLAEALKTATYVKDKEIIQRGLELLDAH